MIRLVAAAFVALACAMPFAAQAQAPRLPAGVDPQNALVIDTTKGRIVIKLRTDIAPQHAARLKQLAVRMFKQAEFRCFNMWRGEWQECKCDA